MDHSTLAARFDNVCERIEKATIHAGRKPHEIHLVAVSKRHEADAVAALVTYWAKKQPSFLSERPLLGENYVQEALDKISAVAALLNLGLAKDLAPDWHFIGHLQSKKAKDVASKFALIHTVDSEKLASNLQRAFVTRAEEAPQPPKVQPVLIQVNIGREPQKGGVLPEDLERLATLIMSMPALSLEGLMCMPPYDSRAEISRPYFRHLYELKYSTEKCIGQPLPHLSMGMSHDFHVAIEEGATYIRVGTDIFGQRQQLA